VIEGFLLGLSSGTVCLAHCAPVLVPLFLGEGDHVGKNAVSLAEFLSGRLAGYLVFSIVAWGAGQLLLNSPQYREIAFGVAYIALALAMVVYGLFISREYCAAKSLKGTFSRLFADRMWIMTIAMGFLTGINLCPPFLLAFSSSAYQTSLWQSITLFMMFFLGTAVYFIPLVFIGLFKVHDKLRIIGKMTALIMAVYFLFGGTIMLTGGLRAL
jgi:sulfite exporter TauE/SafE